MIFTHTNSSLITGSDAVVRRMHFLMGTFVGIEAAGREREDVIVAVDEAFSEMKRIERILSKFLEGSAVYEINRASGLWPVHVPPAVFWLIHDAIQFGHLTKRAFDITVGPIMDLWESAQKKDLIPGKDEIQEARNCTGIEHINLDRDGMTVFLKKPGMKIDLGGIGKGYAIDKAIEVLKKRNITKALINGGGNIYYLDDDYANVGIKNPLWPDRIIATIPLKDSAVATSANYERSFCIHGKRYGHLMDPKTGYPVQKGVLSVSIVSPSAKLSDIYSTAVFVLGPESGMSLIEGMDGLEGLVIEQRSKKCKVNVSTGLREYIN